MIIPLAWWVGQDNLQATERRIVRPLAFLSKAVTDIVRVSFIKLIERKIRDKVNTAPGGQLESECKVTLAMVNSVFLERWTFKPFMSFGPL